MIRTRSCHVPFDSIYIPSATRHVPPPTSASGCSIITIAATKNAYILLSSEPIIVGPSLLV